MGHCTLSWNTNHRLIELKGPMVHQRRLSMLTDDTKSSLSIWMCCRESSVLLTHHLHPFNHLNKFWLRNFECQYRQALTLVVTLPTSKEFLSKAGWGNVLFFSWLVYNITLNYSVLMNWWILVRCISVQKNHLLPPLYNKWDVICTIFVCTGLLLMFLTDCLAFIQRSYSVDPEVL